MQLQGQIAIVTGADSGMRPAIAASFAQEGADIAITCHADRDGGGETARRMRQAGRQAGRR
jgi:NAD(P)-dependent dehydrogenase (short-subunit alcohol dehydrogenase family)